MQIFISYRRDDTGPTSLLLSRALESRFGDGSVFIDLDDIPHGADFADTIQARLDASDVVLVVVGPHWLRLLREREVQGSQDWVRREAALALTRRNEGRLRVVPVFVDGAELGPGLPEDLLALATSNGVPFLTRAPDEGERRVVEAVQDETFDRKLQREKRQMRSLLLTLPAALLLFLLAWAQLFDLIGVDSRIHHATIAMAHAVGPVALPPREMELAIIGLDDATAAQVVSSETRRLAIAGVLQKVAGAGAKAVAIDFNFDEPSSEAADAALEAALAAARPLLPVRLAVIGGTGDRAGEGPEPKLLPRFAAHAGWGVACVGQRAEIVSTLPLGVVRDVGNRKQRLVPSLGLATYAAVKGVSQYGTVDALELRLPLEFDADARGNRTRPIDVSAFSVEALDEDPDKCHVLRRGDLLLHQWLDERAPALPQLAARLSMADVLRGDPAALAQLKDRIVFVGDTRQLTGTDDSHVTGSGAVPGVSLVAAQVDGLLRQSAIRPLTALEQLLLLVLTTAGGAALAIVLRGPRARWLLPSLLVAALVSLVLAVLAYRGLRLLAGPHYALLGLMLGAWITRLMQRR